MIKKVLFVIICELLGLVFIISGLTKLFPVELFELTLIDIGFSTWATAPVLARLMIASEFFLGFLLMLNIKLKKFTLKATIIVLLIFTVYLIVLILVEGNMGNCKCFGDYIYMTPLESIIKNLVMIGITIFLLYWNKGFKLPFQKVFLIIGLTASLALPFILNPPDFIMAYRSDVSNTGYELPLDTLYRSPDLTPPEVDLRKGKYIIACMSLTCSHCRVAAYKFHILKKENPGMPVYFFLNGDPDKLESFFTETKSGHIPHMLLNGERFINIGGLKMPSIMFVKNSVVEKKTNFIELSEKDVLEWMK